MGVHDPFRWQVVRYWWLMHHKQCCPEGHVDDDLSRSSTNLGDTWTSANARAGAEPAPQGTAVLAHIGMARVRGTVAYNDERGVTPSYTAPLDSDDGSLIPLAYVKDLAPKELLNELLGASIGCSLGLPMPAAYLAIASEDQGPWKHSPVIDNNGHRLLFATIAVDSPRQMLFHYKNLGHAITRRLIDWPHFEGMIAFDEWLANVDRHLGNILVSGDGAFWLIDHSHLLSSNEWEADKIKQSASASFINKIADWIKGLVSEHERNAIQADAQSACIKHSEIDLRSVMSSFPLNDLFPADDLDAAMSFLSGRVSHTAGLIQARLS